MKFAHLTGDTETRKHLNRKKYASWSSQGIVLAFVALCDAYPFFTAVVLACAASLMPLLVISLHSRLPLLST